jgi:hypothetical protein
MGVMGREVFSFKFIDILELGPGQEELKESWSIENLVAQLCVVVEKVSMVIWELGTLCCTSEFVEL